jgi:surfeit locus 1 family protein
MTSKVYKSFRPGRMATAALFSLTILFAMLGNWQIQRADEKRTTEQQHQAATNLSLDYAIAGESRFSRVKVSGHYDTDRHFLLDNQIWQGRGGVYVFTPFYTVSGTKILVNRGWLPLAPDRKTMPDIPTPNHETVITGMLNILPVPGRVLGDADVLKQDQWPQLVTYLNNADMSDALDIPLENWIIQLSKTEQTGFEGREWKPVFLSSNKHKAYAFQWFALATASVIMWIYIGFRRTSGEQP